MKKIKLGLLAVLVLFLVGCSGLDGSAYQKYWWSGAPQHFYDTNPSTPDTIYNDVYFPTDAGSFYMEYIAWDGSGYYMYYTVTINKGELLTPGEDVWYEILLLSTGPSLYEWDYANSIHADVPVVKPESDSPGIEVSTASTKTQGPIIGTEERVYPFGTVSMKYGRLQ